MSGLCSLSGLPPSARELNSYWFRYGLTAPAASRLRRSPRKYRMTRVPFASGNVSVFPDIGSPVVGSMTLAEGAFPPRGTKSIFAKRIWGWLVFAPPGPIGNVRESGIKIGVALLSKTYTACDKSREIRSRPVRTAACAAVSAAARRVMLKPWMIGTNNNPRRIVVIAITTRSSVSVKARDNRA